MNSNRRIGKKLHRLNLLMILHLRSLDDSVIPPAQMRMLEFVTKNAGCTQADVAEAMQVSPASVAQSIKRMEASGFIKRSACEGNLRANKLEVTKSGIDAAKSCRAVFDELEKRMSCGFTDEEHELLDDMLSRLISNLESGDTGSMNNMELSKLVQSDQ